MWKTKGIRKVKCVVPWCFCVKRYDTNNKANDLSAVTELLDWINLYWVQHLAAHKLKWRCILIYLFLELVQINFTFSDNVRILFIYRLIDLLCLTPLSAIFSYIMATSFSGGRIRSTRREPPTMGKQLVNFITCSCESSAPFL